MTQAMGYPSSDHLGFFISYLRWGMRLSEVEKQKILFLPPEVTYAMSATASELDDLQQGQIEVHLRQTNALLLAGQVYELVLMPIWVPPVEGPGHMTLLVRRREGEDKGFRYYESLHKMKDAHLAAVRCMVRCMGFSDVDAPQTRTNVKLQSGTDCVFHVMHHAEDEIRAALGEGFATQGVCDVHRVSRLRQVLIQLTRGLAQELGMWRQDVVQERNKRIEADEKKAAMDVRLRKAAKIAVEVEADVAAVATACINEGAAPIGPVWKEMVPESFGERLRKRAKTTVKAKASKAEALPSPKAAAPEAAAIEADPSPKGPAPKVDEIEAPPSPKGPAPEVAEIEAPPSPKALQRSPVRQRLTPIRILRHGVGSLSLHPGGLRWWRGQRMRAGRSRRSGTLTSRSSRMRGISSLASPRIRSMAKPL